MFGLIIVVVAYHAILGVFGFHIFLLGVTHTEVFSAKITVSFVIAERYPEYRAKMQFESIKAGPLDRVDAVFQQLRLVFVTKNAIQVM